ncbi:MAG: RNA polymerase sigma factor [Chitinophagales bacterium]
MSKNHIQQQLSSIEDYLRNFSFYMTKDNSKAEDLYQETILKILTKGHLFKKGTNFKAWSATIMRNLFINNYRRRKKANVVLDYSTNDYLINSSNTVDNKAEGEIAYKELSGLINNLSKPLAVPFIMRFRGYKYDEIAEALDLPMGTVKSRIFLARRQLKKEYHKLMSQRVAQ